MNNRKLLEKNYKKYSAAEGSQHIASEYAIQKIQDLVSLFKIKNVLEVGLGIGSIAGTLLKVNKDLSYTGTEDNDFCLRSLPVLLGSNYERLNIYNSINDLPNNKGFDLIIVDGKDDGQDHLKDLLSPNGIVILEGDRLEQQEILSSMFLRHKMVHSISLSKNKSYSPFASNEWQGGLKIIFADPTFRQFLWWLKEKTLTKLKYQYPGRYFGV